MNLKHLTKFLYELNIKQIVQRGKKIDKAALKVIRLIAELTGWIMFGKGIYHMIK